MFGIHYYSPQSLRPNSVAATRHPSVPHLCLTIMPYLIHVTVCNLWLPYLHGFSDSFIRILNFFAAGTLFIFMCHCNPGIQKNKNYLLTNKRNKSGQAIKFLFCVNKIMLKGHGPCVFHENTMPLLKIVFVKYQMRIKFSVSVKNVKTDILLRIFSVISTN